MGKIIVTHNDVAHERPLARVIEEFHSIAHVLFVNAAKAMSSFGGIMHCKHI